MKTISRRYTGVARLTDSAMPARLMKESSLVRRGPGDHPRGRSHDRYEGVLPLDWEDWLVNGDDYDIHVRDREAFARYVASVKQAYDIDLTDGDWCWAYVDLREPWWAAENDHGTFVALRFTDDL